MFSEQYCIRSEVFEKQVFSAFNRIIGETVTVLVGLMRSVNRLVVECLIAGLLDRTTKLK